MPPLGPAFQPGSSGYAPSQLLQPQPGGPQAATGQALAAVAASAAQFAAQVGRAARQQGGAFAPGAASFTPSPLLQAPAAAAAAVTAVAASAVTPAFAKQVMEAVRRQEDAGRLRSAVDMVSGKTHRDEAERRAKEEGEEATREATRRTNESNARKSLAQDAEKAAREQRTKEEERQTVVRSRLDFLSGGTVGGAGRMQAGAEMMGASKAGLGAASVAAFSGIVNAAEAATPAFNTLYNSSLTTAQKIDGLGDAFLPGYKVLREFFEAAGGVTEALRKQALAQELALGKQQAEARVRGQTAPLEAERLAAEARVAAVGKYQKEGVLTFDRATVAGQIAAQEQGRLLPAKDSLVEAQRDREAAGRERASAAQKAADAMFAFNTAQDQADAARGKYQGKVDFENRTGLRDKVGKRAALDEEQKALAEVVIRQAEAVDKLNQAKAKGVEFARLESAERQKVVTVMQAELANVQAKEQRAQGAARRLGGMNDAEFAFSRQSYDLLKRGGADALRYLPAEQISAAERINPDLVDRFREQLGSRRAKGLPNFERESGADPANLNRYRREGDQLQVAIKNEIKIDEELLAQKIGREVGGSVGRLIETIKTEIKATTDRIERNQRDKAANQ